MTPKKTSKAELRYAIGEFISVIDIEIGFDFGDKLPRLVEVIASSQPRFLTPVHAMMIVFDACSDLLATSGTGRVGLIGAAENKDLYDRLIQNIAEYIDSFPRKYLFKLELPSFPNWNSCSLDLAPGIRLRSDELPASFALQSLQPTTAPRVFSTYLEIETEGYSDFSFDSYAVSHAIDRAKIVAYFLTVSKLCKSVRSLDGHKAQATLVDLSSGKASAVQMPASLARRFGEIIVDMDSLKVFDVDHTARSLLASVTERIASTQEEMTEAFLRGAVNIGKFLSLQEKAEHQKVAAAIQLLNCTEY